MDVVWPKLILHSRVYKFILEDERGQRWKHSELSSRFKDELQ